MGPIAERIDAFRREHEKLFAEKPLDRIASPAIIPGVRLASIFGST
jgi:hypothetical protein